MIKNTKDIYNEILTNEEIINQYKMIAEHEKSIGGWAFHNFLHIQNVTIIVEKILTGLGFAEDFIYKAKIACLLHDTGAIEGKENHAYRSYEFAKKYFNDNNINFENIELVLEAIRIHSDGFDTDNIIALSLIMADKLDIKKTRISEAGKKVIGNRQYAHIDDVKLNLNDNLLEVNFITDGNIDLDEVNEFYFTKKVFKAIQAFSEKIGLNHKILIDNQEWIIKDKKR